MFRNKLEKFIVKRVLICLAVLSAADLLFFAGSRWRILAGLLSGALISLGRLITNEWILRKTIEAPRGKAAASILAFTGSQLVLLLAIVLTNLLGEWVLYGFVAGALTVPLVVMINSVTEAFGITKNNFE